MCFNKQFTMLGFGDDEKSDDEKEEKYVDVANGMADSSIKRSWFSWCQQFHVGKNFGLDLYERSGRTRPEYVDSVYKLLEFSPPISSKVSKNKIKLLGCI